MNLFFDIFMSRLVVTKANCSIGFLAWIIKHDNKINLFVIRSARSLIMNVTEIQEFNDETSYFDTALFFFFSCLPSSSSRE